MLFIQLHVVALKFDVTKSIFHTLCAFFSGRFLKSKWERIDSSGDCDNEGNFLGVELSWGKKIVWGWRKKDEGMYVDI